MQTQQTDSTKPAGTARDLALRLAPLLMQQGLQGTVQRYGIIMVRNPAASATDDPRGKALNPGMKQPVTLIQHDGGLWWAWVWSGPTRAPCSASGPSRPEQLRKQATVG